MIEKITAQVKKWATKFKNPPIVTEETPLKDLARSYPHLWSFLEERYHLSRLDLEASSHLKGLSQKFDLPPAQIIFMELQLENLKKRVEEVTAIEAKNLMKQEPSLQIFDVRESWEHPFGSIPGSLYFSPEVLNQLKREKNKDQPILMYCHFGIRSLDAAHHLAQLGFTRLYVILGGIDAWSQQVDPSISRYTGAYC